MTRHSPPIPAKRRFAAFTLIEALVASTLLGMVTLAVISAVASAQSLSFEGQKQILAVMAADDLMTELMTLPYADLQSRNGQSQPVGQMATMAGAAYPPSCWAVGRSVSVIEETLQDAGLGVQIKGLRVTVTANDEFRVLMSIESFMPEPAS